MITNNRLTLAAILASTMAISACTTSTKVAVMQPGDSALSCAELQTQFANLDVIERDADRDQGLNGANVAAAIVFPLAIIGNYMGADEAKDLARERRTHLMTFWNQKQCVRA